MPFIKDINSLLIETMTSDMKYDVSRTINESAIRDEYAKLESVSQPIVYGAEMIPVVKVDGKFFTEMNFLAPYMKTNGIKSVTEALDNLAKANNLPAKAVGLLVESQGDVTAELKKACEAGKGKAAHKKVDKATEICKKLEGDGYCVRCKKECNEGKLMDKIKNRKKGKEECADGEVCEVCGKPMKECKCKK